MNDKRVMAMVHAARSCDRRALDAELSDYQKQVQHLRRQGVEGGRSHTTHTELYQFCLEYMEMCDEKS